MAVAAGTKEAKYTQGFLFQQDSAGREISRQLVERSCGAISALLREVFVQVEKNVLQQLSLGQASVGQDKLLAQLSDILCARPLLERAVQSAVVCAFAVLEDQARGKTDNHSAVVQNLAYFRERSCETLDLPELLQIQDKITHSNNCNRPLLVHLNGQLAVVFGLTQSRLHNCPLGPATLMSGLVVGMLCVRADIAAKRTVLQIFEREFFARLSVLLNSITLRLEEEGVVATRVLGFDEQNAGPVGEVLKAGPLLGVTALEQRVCSLRQLLTQPGDFAALSPEAVSDLQKLLSEQADHQHHWVDLLSELRRQQQQLFPVLQRADAHHQETVILANIRKDIAIQLNALLQDKCLPPVMQEFLQYPWQNVLFDVALGHGIGSEPWVEATALMAELLQSISPVKTEEQRAQLMKQVPVLVKTLRECLERANCSLAETSTFFAQLKSLHLANVQHKLDEQDFTPWKPLSDNASVPTELTIVSAADRLFYQQVNVLMGQ